jgi:hypothetical protein
MKPFTARIVYCVCLSALLAACAALPEPLPLASKDAVAPLALSERVRVGPTAELASTMRLHAELAYSYGDAQTSIIVATLRHPLSKSPLRKRASATAPCRPAISNSSAT